MGKQAVRPLPPYFPCHSSLTTVELAKPICEGWIMYDKAMLGQD